MRAEQIPAERPNCELCGDPMPPGEEMFKYHGYSGPCTKPPLWKPYETEALKAQALFAVQTLAEMERQRDELLTALVEALEHLGDLSRPLDVRVEDAYCVTKAAIAKAEGK
jgi:hypothetical protein